MADYLPLFKPGQAITLRASADVIGGRLVEVTGAGTVAHAGAASTKVVGVAGFDAPNGTDVVVFAGGVQLVQSSAAITAGDLVQAAATGKGATGAVAPLGVALSAATAADQPVRVLFNR